MTELIIPTITSGMQTNKCNVTSSVQYNHRNECDKKGSMMIGKHASNVLQQT
jgi:hypothetical protein